MDNFTYLLRSSLLALCMLFVINASSQTTIDSEHFETGWGIWNDGGNDCARRSTAQDSPTGSYSIRIRDNSGSSRMNSDVVDISSYTSIDITFDYHTIGMESGEDFWIRYYDGASWYTVATYTRGTDFNNNTTYTTTVTLTDGAPYNFSANSQFRIQNDASSNDDRVYIDYVDLIGYSTPNPEINIQGNANNISDGDTLPETADDTEFGPVSNGSTLDHTFTIQNTGTSTLNLTGGTPLVDISGNAAFTIQTQPSGPTIASSGSLTFVVRFAPTALGTVTADISIDNDDSDEDPYTFRVQGTGITPAPEMNVTGNGTTILDGDTTPSALDDTDFGSVPEAAGSAANTFTIENLGPINLSLTDPSPYINITGHTADFILTANPTTPITASGSTTFTITFDPTAEGTRSATVSIANNDSDENPYTFDIQGFGAGACGQTVIHNADFESGTDGWTDGGSDAARVFNATRSYSNNYSLELRDDDAAGTNSSFTSPLFDLSSYDKVDVKFFFTAYNVEDDENFFIEYSSDSGSNWTTVSDYHCGNVSGKDGDYESTNTIIFYGKTSTLLSSNYTFPAATTSQFRIRSDASDDTDLIYIDNITITGTIYCNPSIGPGGVTGNLDLWLKADQLDGFGVDADGALVNKWTDNGKGNHAETVVTGQEPVYRDNSTQNFNFNPVVDFENNNATSNGDMTYIISDGSRDELSATSGFNSHDIYMVVMPDVNVTTSIIPLDTFCSTDPLGSTYAEDVTGFGYGNYSARFSNERFGYCIGTSSSYGRATTDGSVDFNQIHIINTRHNSGDTGVNLYINNNLFGNTTANSGTWAHTNDTRYWLGRSQYWKGSFDGRIGEIITFSSKQSDVSATDARNRIQSYLAVKYGITLGVNGTSQDYVDSDGTVIWDQSVNSGYNYDIAGIGRDDGTVLYQKQSSSTNDETDGSGPIEGVLTIGLTDIYNTNEENKTMNSANTIADKDYLMWGNNGIDLNLAASTVTVDMSAGIAGLTTNVTFTGMQRIWKVVEKGDIGPAKISILTSAIRNITPPGDYLMFISDTGIFDPTADYRIMSENGNSFETDYDFDGVNYITFGYAPHTIVERSIYFDGATDYVDVDDALNLNSSDFTISSWIKRGASSANTSILSKRDAAYTEGYDFKVNATGHIEMSWKNGATQTITSNTIVPVDEWHQVAVIYSGGTANLYIDGVLDKTESLTAPVNTARDFNIAAVDKSTSFYHGNIDEVRIWDAALSTDQLHYIMNQEILDNVNFVDGRVIPQTITKNEVATVPWNNLAGYYPMRTFAYTNCNDESGNDNHGALINLDTVDFQTAPLPYESQGDGAWTTDATWLNNDVQVRPNSFSIVDGVTPIDWNIVETNHNVTIDTNANLGRERSVLGLMVSSNELQVNGNTGAGTGNGLTVTHYLKLDGIIDLEGESQLIQTTGSDLDVTSAGVLERDQQGTADTYTYNYWAAPVGVSNTTTNNNDYTLPDVMNDGASNINFITSGYDGTNSSPIGIADYWIWKFANQLDDDYSSWQHVRSTGSLKAGEGYTMKGPGTGGISTPQNYVYNGKPHNGDVNLTLSAGNDYLVGNPYASAIDAQQFILDNGTTISGAGATTGTLYFWEHWGGGSHILAEYQGGYATYNLSGGTPSASMGTNDPDVGTGGTPTKTPGRYIPVGQGFFVVAETAGTINFNNGQRIFQKEGGTSTFMKTNNGSKKGITNTTRGSQANEDLRMKLRIGLNSVNTIHRQLLLTIDDNATDGFDWGYDGKLNEDIIDDAYWMIDNEKYNIQARDDIENNTVLPMGIHTDDDGNNTFTIDSMENIPSDMDILLHDIDLGIYHDLRVGDYEVYLIKGEYLTRFEITFNMSEILEEPENEMQSIDTHFSNAINSIVLINPSLKQVKSIEMFNMLGQKIYVNNSYLQKTSYSSFKVNNLNSGAYIISIETDNGIINKKVIVE